VADGSSTPSVSGGVVGAKDGTLTIMVGGAEGDLADCRPVLDVLGKQVIHVGDLGAGHAVKALNNLLSATSLLASSEVLATAIEFGLDPEVVLDVVNRSSGRSWSTELKLPKYVLTDGFDSGFGLRLMLKDIQITTSLARAPVTPCGFRRASVTGMERTTRRAWLISRSPSVDTSGSSPSPTRSTAGADDDRTM
jgi:3-hydroxyisobutyrate dehydrogenase